MKRYWNAYVIKDQEDGEIIVKCYDEDEADKMMCDVSKMICFSDCDDTFEVLYIFYHGREVRYAGWQRGMLYQYYYTATGDLAWEECFPNWDH